MKTVRVVLVSVAASAAVSAAALGAGSVQSVNLQMPAPSPGRNNPWEHPLAQGIVMSPERAQQSGALPFRMVLPPFGLRPTETMVSDPAKVDPAHRTAGMVYRFPTGKTFPMDGRVLVLESPSQVPAERLEAIAAQSAAEHGGDHFRYVKLAGRIPAILVQDHGVGRVHLVANGVAIDITGPATSPDAVVALAEKLARQLG